MKSYTINNRRTDCLIKERLVAEAAEEAAAEQAPPKKQYRGFESFQNLKAISKLPTITSLLPSVDFTAIEEIGQMLNQSFSHSFKMLKAIEKPAQTNRIPFFRLVNETKKLPKYTLKNQFNIGYAKVSNPIRISCKLSTF